MKAFKTCRSKNSFISLNRDRKFRDNVIVFGKRQGHVVFLTTFNNSFWTYEIITVPVSNGTYKIKIVSLDDLGNINSGQEGTAVIDFYPLPPVNVAVSVTGYDATLTWEHSSAGAPDNYIIYGNNGSGVIDKSTPLATISGSLLIYTLTLAGGQWKFVVEAKVGLVESDTLNTVSTAIPSTAVIPPKPGLDGPSTSPFAVTGLILENVSVGKVKISFLWTHGSRASKFNVYHNGGSGDIDFSSYDYQFNRQGGTLQTYTTPQLHSVDENVEYKFAVRAVTVDDVEETNEDIYSIYVDGVAPDEVDTLSLDTIF